MIDWEFLGNFSTGGKLFYDANGLQMVNKTLCYRQDFAANLSTCPIASNFYPI